MPLPSPNLDDRDFRQLLDDARTRILQSHAGWTDLSPSDPGMVLLEVFAYLTETMLYRLNRLPDKVYIELLRLIGVQLQPPAAASVVLRFSRLNPGSQPVTIPRGTRVTLNRSGAGEPPVFVTVQSATLAPGQEAVSVNAYDSEFVEAEFAGKGTGQAGQFVRAQYPPIIATTVNEPNLIVAVETTPGETNGRVPAIEYNGKAYRIWREVESFANLGDDRHCYIVDRLDGVISFAPEARLLQDDGTLAELPVPMADVPEQNREIRLWYWHGGGTAGKIGPNTLTVLKDPLPGVQVTNPEAATTGRAAESVENALLRGPQQLHSLQRAVTAQDFEANARRFPAVARAKAMTSAAFWRHAVPGTVEVLLVPALPEADRAPGKLTLEALQQQETEEARAQVQQDLDRRRPLGTRLAVNWAHYKPVRVQASIIVRREESSERVRQRVLERLYQAINPLPNSYNPSGWPFGQALRVSNVYDIVLREPGVRWVDDVTLYVDEVPDTAVSTVIKDANQPRGWYAGSGTTLFRSLNDGDGWEAVRHFPDDGGPVRLVRSHPDRPGLLALLTSLTNPQNNNTVSRLYISWDCGETWEATPSEQNFRVDDLAWTSRNGTPLLLMAAVNGLYELPVEANGERRPPSPLLVDPSNQNRGFYAVVVATDAQGVEHVAVAAVDNGGVFLSYQGGRTNTFRRTSNMNEDVRELAIQRLGSRTFLWAGTTTSNPDDPGHGCYAWELLGRQDPPNGWQAFNKNWTGGSCRSLAFAGSRVLAATYRSGVLILETASSDPAWQVPDVNSGLRLRDRPNFAPLVSLDVDPATPMLMAGGPNGIYRSRGAGLGTRYEWVSAKAFEDKVTLPENWLFVSGEHDISVVAENETGGD